MKNHGFYECTSSAQVMEILERLNVEQIMEVEAMYGCSGSELAEQIMKSKQNERVLCLDMEGNLIPDKELTDAQIDDVMLTLMQKQIDEQIRSNKVIEGVMKDIYSGIDHIAGVLGDMNIREELKYTFQKEQEIENAK